MTFRHTESIEADERGLEQVLGDFRASVHAWSDAEFNRPRAMAPLAYRRSWRAVLATALGCVIAAGSVAGGLYEHRQREQVARVAAYRSLEREQQLAAETRAQADEKLLAGVDSDVSREVPTAMEPLAQLMDGDGSQ